LARGVVDLTGFPFSGIADEGHHVDRAIRNSVNPIAIILQTGRGTAGRDWSKKNHCAAFHRQRNALKPYPFMR